MVIAISVVSVILFVILLIFISDVRLARRRFQEGVALENQGDYMEACYHYAISGWKGHRKSECIRKIRSMWLEHGPFDFAPLLDKYTDPNTHCSGEAGHGITLTFIEKAISEES